MDWIKDDSEGRFIPMESGDVIGYMVFPLHVEELAKQRTFRSLDEIAYLQPKRKD